MVIKGAVTRVDGLALRRMRFCVLGLLSLSWIAPRPISSQDVRKTPIAKQLSRIRPAIVQIAICRPFGETNKTDVDPFYKDGTRIFGTGFLADDAGDVLTPAHVAARAQQELQFLHQSGVKASLNIGIDTASADPIGALSHATTYVPGSFRKQDGEFDLALLHIDLPERLTNALNKLAPIIISADLPQEGDGVLALGFQGNSSNLVVTIGTVASSTVDVPKFSRDNGGTRLVEMYQVDIHAGPGDSGAPVLRRRDGAIIGVLIESNGSGIANIIPSRDIVRFLSQNGRPKRRAGKM